MFGMKTRIYTAQLKRAATIENLVKVGIFDRQVELLNSSEELNDHDGAIIAGAVNYILTWDVGKQLQTLGGTAEDAELIYSRARLILKSDSQLEQLVIRLLYEIASLGHLLQKDEWAKNFLRNHPRILEVLTIAKNEHPELLRDADESKFKILFAQFIDNYLPEMKQSASTIFN